MRTNHHKDCKFTSYAEAFKDLPFDLEEEGLDPKFAEECGMMSCHEDCPVLLEALGRGRELAKIHGW